MKYLLLPLLLLTGCVTIRYNQKPLDNFMIGCMRAMVYYECDATLKCKVRTDEPFDYEIRYAEAKCEEMKPKFKEPTVQ